MAEHKPKFNLYGLELNGTGTKKFTEPYPKLDADADDFANASNAMMDGYGYEIMEATLQSETTVYTAG